MNSTPVDTKQLTDFSSVVNELTWLESYIDVRIKSYFQTETDLPAIDQLSAPEHPTPSEYASLIQKHNLGKEERLIIALSIAPILKPALLDTFFLKNKNFDRGFSEFGGVKGNQHGGFLPTIETALFVLSGDDLGKRIDIMKYLDPDCTLFHYNLLCKGETPKDEPDNCASLTPHPSLLSLLLHGEYAGPELSSDFPAKQIKTSLDWEDLILDEEVMNRINEIQVWLKHQDLLLNEWGLNKKLKRGYRCLFYGPPGTGKTLTATLLGKSTGMPVYRVDLSLMVSKYIGETEKNLNKVFNMAESQNWILFFDEADALFGSRVQTSTSNDRHANQEIAFLLQRIEDFDGLVILASNLKGNIDDAFARRFQSMIYFPLPDKEERYLLWKSYFNGGLPIDSEIDFKGLADKYEVSGGNIVNILRHSAIKAVESQHQKVIEEDVIEGLRREFKQLGKTV